MKKGGTGTRAARTANFATRLLLIALTQCSAMGPFEGPQPSPDTHALCYNRWSTSPQNLHALAVTACSGSAPRFVSQSLNLSACPLLVPMQVSFACGG